VQERIVAALADRYRIERELGAGGMATVYLAHDLRHDREVAVKVLRPELAAAIGADRFLAEIHTTAKLQHPHILPLFDSGAADGFLYYVMPYIDGESLQQRLARSGALGVDDVTRIVADVGSALDYAHRQGVVHRDIKPANILIYEGTALLADFGIARAAAEGDGERLTGTGISLGTPHYMSPEQASGERDAGPPSDIYSLGVVAYELLSGQPPFNGRSVQAVLAQLMTAEPAPLTTPRAGLNAAVQKAMARDPADRFATGAAFAEALGSDRAFVPGRHRLAPLPIVAGLALAALAAFAGWRYLRRGTPATSAAPRLIAVLPFANLTGDSSKEFFGRGLSIEITEQLHRLHIAVVGSAAATTAARRFRTGADVDVQAAGRALGADAVLNGTLLPSSEGDRVGLELTDVKTQAVLWSERYQLGANLFAVQDSVAGRVASALRLQLTPAEFAAARSGRSVDPAAHDMVVRAKAYAEQRDEAGLIQATTLFAEALRRDSTYADAWAGLAEAYNLHAVFNDVTPGDYFRLASDAADRALELDSASVTAHRARAFLAVFWRHDWPLADREFRQALALDSLSPSNWLFRTWYFMAMGPWDSVRGSILRAHQLDSLAPVIAARMADVLYDGGDATGARAELIRMLRYDPANGSVRLSLASVYAALGQCDSSLALFPRSAALPPYAGAYRYAIRVWARCGQPERIAGLLRIAEQSRQAGGTPSGFAAAIAATYVANRDVMYRWLDYAFRTGDWQLFFVKGDPEFAPYRNEPRFEALLRQAGMRP
jgi:serine/threonine-protein kinase